MGDAPVRVRLLGPVRVERAGAPLPLGGAKRMAVLAFLALRAPRVVSRPALVRAIWGDDAPETAYNALQVHVSALRGALGRTSILPSGDGYRLGAQIVVDLQEFETAVLRGVAELAGGNPAAAAATLRRALSWWNGPALHGLRDAPFAEPEAIRLESSRLVALGHRLEADIQLGRHHDVEPELGALVAANPLQEELRVLLMECLHRGGHHAEALQVFEAGRAVLREELGVDPSPILKEAQRRVLNSIVHETRASGRHRNVDGVGSPRPGGVFICYRRADARGEAGRLYDRLVARFGEDQVFMDVGSLPPGLDFMEFIKERVSHCKVMLVVIGENWLASKDKGGIRRLDDQNDIVRNEVEFGLAREGLPVIPVLVDRTQMPRSDQLPMTLKPLTRRTALPLRHESFPADTERLASAIQAVIAGDTT